MKNQKFNTEGIMNRARLYFKCGSCKGEKAIICFPKIYLTHNKINERQQIYSLYRCILDTQHDVAVKANIAESTV